MVKANATSQIEKEKFSLPQHSAYIPSSVKSPFIFSFVVFYNMNQRSKLLYIFTLHLGWVWITPYNLKVFLAQLCFFSGLDVHKSSVRNLFWKNWKFTGKHLSWGVFLIQLQEYRISGRRVSWIQIQSAKRHLKDVLKMSYEDTQDISARCLLYA